MLTKKETDINSPDKIYVIKGHSTVQLEELLNNKSVDDLIMFFTRLKFPDVKFNIRYDWGDSEIMIWKYVLETDEEWDTRQKIRRGVGNVAEKKIADEISDEYDTYLRLKAKFEPTIAIGIPTPDFGATMPNYNDHRGPSRFYED